ncbi:hypothetical protein, partial [Pseudomonas aeruginosa]|uniref:hypothetical protein n=1 Tax=Pseudomonas aeruginosa TaxID=287 RepID=UPI003747954A
LGGKRTSLLAHQTPLSRRGFSPKSVSGISRPLQTNNGWEWVNESSQLNSVWVSHKSLLEKQAKVGGKVSPASIEESSVSWRRVEQNIKRIEKHLDALRDEYS